MSLLASSRPPDFDLLRRALTRQGKLERVPLLELFADREIIAAVMGVSPAEPTDAVGAVSPRPVPACRARSSARLAPRPALP